jgi:single-stranded DNA-binding protein
MSREAHVRFCESAGLRCPALLTYVEGRLRIREYEAKDNGGKRQRAEIIATRVQFLGARPTDAKGATTVEEPVPPVDAEVPF